jgi:hypothetical protein
MHFFDRINEVADGVISAAQRKRLKSILIRVRNICAGRNDRKFRASPSIFRFIFIVLSFSRNSRMLDANILALRSLWLVVSIMTFPPLTPWS